MYLERARSVGELAAAVEQAREHGGYELEGGLGLEHHHVELPVAGLVAVRDRDVELYLREVHEQDAEPFAFDRAPVELDGEARLLGHRVEHGRREVGHGAEQALARLRAVHDGGVVARSGHDAEAESASGHLDLPEVEVERAPLAHHLRERVRLERGGQVEREQVRRSGGEGQHRHPRVRQKVAHCGYRAVAAARHHGVEGGGVAKQVAHVGRAVGGAQADLVAVAGERAREVVDGALAEARGEVVDDEQFHRHPFNCYDGMVQHGAGNTRQGTVRIPRCT